MSFYLSFPHVSHMLQNIIEGIELLGGVGGRGVLRYENKLLYSWGWKWGLEGESIQQHQYSVTGKHRGPTCAVRSEADNKGLSGESVDVSWFIIRVLVLVHDPHRLPPAHIQVQWSQTPSLYLHLGVLCTHLYTNTYCSWYVSDLPSLSLATVSYLYLVSNLRVKQHRRGCSHWVWTFRVQTTHLQTDATTCVCGGVCGSVWVSVGLCGSEWIITVSGSRAAVVKLFLYCLSLPGANTHHSVWWSEMETQHSHGKVSGSGTHRGATHYSSRWSPAIK